MLLPHFKPRKFTFTPYYYDKETEEQEEDQEPHRIKFRRIRRKSTLVKKPISRLVLLAILVLFALYYFWKLVEEESRTFKIEDVIIEESPSD